MSDNNVKVGGIIILRYLGYFDSFNVDQDDDGLPDWLDKDK
ncbi:MAG: hypothetical protein ACI9LM_005491 [Alteromonadaceae bacterium]|jgi:hypothetical protein